MTPTTSVVIPTTLRPDVRNAIQSARAQADDKVTVEVIVVIDRHESEIDASALGLVDGADDVLFGDRRGAASARNQGVRAASGDNVAFLDDDDIWLPGKLAAQLAALEEHDVDIVASQVRQRQSGASDLSVPVPATCYRPGQNVEDYLFRQRRPSIDRSSLFTSTLLVNSTVARMVDWDAGLKRHQDWDWLIRAARAGYRIWQVPEPLVVLNTGSSGSISASPDWRSSIEWATRWRGVWDDRTLVDFLLAQTMRYALNARSWHGTRTVAREALSLRTVPSLGPVLIALAGAMPRGLLERVMLRSGVEVSDSRGVS